MARGGDDREDLKSDGEDNGDGVIRGAEVGQFDCPAIEQADVPLGQRAVIAAKHVDLALVCCHVPAKVQRRSSRSGFDVGTPDPWGRRCQASAGAVLVATGWVVRLPM